jgi:hypothetical protein
MLAFRPVAVFFIASERNRLAKPAIDALEFPRVNLQIVILKNIVLAL